jgi:hypothetical protein
LLSHRPPAILAVLALSACSSGGPSGPEPPLPVDCTQASIVALAPAQHLLVDPRLSGSCLHFPAPGPAEAEYAVVALSGAGVVTPTGVSEAYLLQADPPPDAPTAREAGGLEHVAGASFRQSGDAEAFHTRLRVLEAAAAFRPGAALGIAPAPFIEPPPVVGDERTFRVCSSTSCTSTVAVEATAAYVGIRGAIYIDDTVPANGFTPSDIAEVGQLFDGATPNMYGIDTVAFGRESDIDANGVVIILLTDAVNALSPNCSVTGSRVLGYFYGLDLLPGSSGNSNGGEVFFSAVPAPTDPGCPVSRNEAMRALGPTFIHEFQHMISFNQHRLLRGSTQPELTWLNEGLSHFAEELGGRQLPDNGVAAGGAPDRETQFHLNNFANAFDYLVEPEDHFLVFPEQSGGTLQERGAAWLFVRWLADQFGGGSPLGTAFTRAVVQTGQVGQENVEDVTGESFDRLAAQWQLASWLDNLPGWSGGSARLQYTSWNLRSEFAALNASRPSVFPRVYPLVPDESDGDGYERTGVVRGGSGRHLILTQPAGGAVTEVRFAAAGGDALSAAVVPRLAVARIR